MFNFLSGWMVGEQITLFYSTYFTTVQNQVGRLVGYINTEGPLTMTQLQFCVIGSQ